MWLEATTGKIDKMWQLSKLDLKSGKEIEKIISKLWNEKWANR